MPFSTAGMNWRGIVPPTTSSTNSKPVPARQRLDAAGAPRRTGRGRRDCFLWRYSRVALRRDRSRGTGCAAACVTDLDLLAREALQRDVEVERAHARGRRTRPCAGSRSATNVGSASASLCSSGTSFASSARFFGSTAERHHRHGHLIGANAQSTAAVGHRVADAGGPRPSRRRRGRPPSAEGTAFMSLPWISRRSPMRSVLPVRATTNWRLRWRASRPTRAGRPPCPRAGRRRPSRPARRTGPSGSSVAARARRLRRGLRGRHARGLGVSRATTKSRNCRTPSSFFGDHVEHRDDVAPAAAPSGTRGTSSSRRDRRPRAK